MESLAKTVFVCADHGLAVIYFLQSDVLKVLLDAGVHVVVLTDDALVDEIQARFAQPGLTVTGMCFEAANRYAVRDHPEMQWWLSFFGGWAVRTGLIRRPWTATFAR
jgi:hypothetical protein